MEKENIYEECLKNIETLKKNEETVPKEELETRYKASYKKLKDMILGEMTDIYFAVCFGGMLFLRKAPKRRLLPFAAKRRA